MKVQVTINRGKGNLQTFVGKVIAETESFFKVTWDDKESKNDVGEWLPKQSEAINCVII